MDSPDAARAAPITSSVAMPALSSHPTAAIDDVAVRLVVTDTLEGG